MTGGSIGANINNYAYLSGSLQISTGAKSVEYLDKLQVFEQLRKGAVGGGAETYFYFIFLAYRVKRLSRICST